MEDCLFAYSELGNIAGCVRVLSAIAVALVVRRPGDNPRPFLEAAASIAAVHNDATLTALVADAVARAAEYGGCRCSYDTTDPLAAQAVNAALMRRRRLRSLLIYCCSGGSVWVGTLLCESDKSRSLRISLSRNPPTTANPRPTRRRRLRLEPRS
jgi:hypothetical protein